MRKFLTRVGFLVWVTLVCFALPEVFAGSGKGWFTRFDVYILGMPIYGLHFLLLCHIAIKTKRTSWPALYLFGIIFGLYEAWVTKVIWAGYPGAPGFAMGGFGEWFGVHETVALVLFYHPVTSFLLPLAVISRLSPAFGKHFPTPDWVFGNGRWALARRLVLLFVWGVLSGHNMPEINGYIQSWLPMIVLIWLGYVLLRPTLSSVNAAATFSKLGFAVALLWLAAIYGVTYQNLLPERLPPNEIQLLTLAFYPILALLIWRAKPQNERDAQPPNDAPARLPFVWLLLLFFVGLASILTGLISTPVGILPLLALVGLGVGSFFWLVIWRLILRRV